MGQRLKLCHQKGPSIPQTTVLVKIEHNYQQNDRAQEISGHKDCQGIFEVIFLVYKFLSEELLAEKFICIVV